MVNDTVYMFGKNLGKTGQVWSCLTEPVILSQGTSLTMFSSGPLGPFGLNRCQRSNIPDSPFSARKLQKTRETIITTREIHSLEFDFRLPLATDWFYKSIPDNSIQFIKKILKILFYLLTMNCYLLTLLSAESDPVQMFSHCEGQCSPCFLFLVVF